MKEIKNKLFNKKEDCCGCMGCVNICPQKAINIKEDDEGFLYPYIDFNKCVNCNMCKKVCPIKNTYKETDDNKYFGFKLINSKKRNESTSGGIFTSIAEYILDKNGVVFGASFDENLNIKHMEVTSILELDKIKKAKYVQSNINNVYLKIKEYLECNRYVLFSGTPCQSHALKLFLGKDYKKLIIVDIICYGVPSPGIWSLYKKYLEKKYKGKLESFCFRDKRNHNNARTVSFKINGKEIAKPLNEDAFCSVYFRNCMLRPSCYNCNYCTTNRCSDFTIGDFWGIEKTSPKFNDGDGVSLVICHTQKSHKIWEIIKNDGEYFECNKENILQPRLIKPTEKARKRPLFMKAKKYLPFSLVVKIFSKI